MDSLLQTLRSIGVLRIVIMVGVAIAMLGFFIFLSSRISTGTMVTLYSDLSAYDSDQMVKALGESEVPFTVSVDKQLISVPKDLVGQARMSLAEKGLPSGGNVGYEIFDKKTGLGVTNFEQNLNQLRALEGELSRTIATLDSVMQARVYLVMPKRELFSREEQTATASVFLKLTSGKSLGQEQVLAIQHLIAAAVPNLKPEKVAIIDQGGNLLAQSEDSGSMSMANMKMEEQRLAIEDRMRLSLQQLLSSTLGFENVRVQISAAMNFDQKTINQETYDPNLQVLRSSQVIEENSEDTDGQQNDQVTVNNNIPGVTTPPATPASTTTSKSNRIEETNNYEIAKTITNEVRNAGKIEKISVAVLVNDIVTKNEDGTFAYAPRSQAELDKIRGLVESSIGFDAARGDVIEVVNLRFADDPLDLTIPEVDSIFGFPTADLMNIAETAVLGIVAVLIMLLVVRPLLNKMLSAGRDQGNEQEEVLEKMIAEQAMGFLAPPEDINTAEEENIDRMIDISKVEGQLRDSSIKKISELVEKHPEDTANIIRGWIYLEN